MRNRKHSLCFVDDDPEELQRFQESFKSLFVVGVGQTLDDALADLRRQGPRKPDLFVLDMYFPEGSLNTKAEQEELRLAWSEYNSAHANFMSVLARLRQTSKGGYALAENVQKKCRSRNYVFFTRKATLEEGMEALRRGALDVIKKPDPNADEIKAATAIQQAGDNALRNRAPEIAEKLSDAIRKSHWWWRHRGAVVSAIVAFLLGYFASILANVSPALLKLFHLH